MPVKFVVSAKPGSRLPQALRRLVGEYTFDQNLDKGTIAYVQIDHPDGEPIHLFWSEGAWRFCEEHDANHTVAWANCEIHSAIPEGGWNAKTGWFGSSAAVPSLLVSEAVAHRSPSLSDVAKVVARALPTELPGRKVVMKHAKKTKEGGEFCCLSGFISCHQCLKHPDTADCFHSVREMVLAIGRSVINLGYCCAEIVEETKQEAKKKSNQSSPASSAANSPARGK